MRLTYYDITTYYFNLLNATTLRNTEYMNNNDTRAHEIRAHVKQILSLAQRIAMDRSILYEETRKWDQARSCKDIAQMFNILKVSIEKWEQAQKPSQQGSIFTSQNS